MNFITLKELKKMVPVASEFKRVPGLKKILEDGIEVILRKQMENHAEVVVYKNGYVSYHAHERYTVFALHNCTHYYYESQGNEHQTIPHNHFEDEEIRALTKQASEKTYIGGLTKECVDAFVSMVYLYDDQTMKIEFNCEDVIRRALEKYGT